MATDEATRRERRRPRSSPRLAAAAPLVLKLPPKARLRVSAALLWEICCANDDLRLERTAGGRLIVMSPAGFATGGRNLKLSMRLGIWAEINGTGSARDSSTGYALPNGAIRSPDASWISHARVQLIPTDQLEKFAPACPDFVAELRSPTDSLKALRRKMAEYIAQGVRLGWLLDPATAKVEVHRPGRAAEVLDRPATLSGGDVLPGFVLDLRGILFD